MCLFSHRRHRLMLPKKYLRFFRNISCFLVLIYSYKWPRPWRRGWEITTTNVLFAWRDLKRPIRGCQRSAGAAPTKRISIYLVCTNGLIKTETAPVVASVSDGRNFESKPGWRGTGMICCHQRRCFGGRYNIGQPRQGLFVPM